MKDTCMHILLMTRLEVCKIPCRRWKRMLIEEVARERMLEDTSSGGGRVTMWAEVVRRAAALSPGQVIAVDPGEKYHGDRLQRAAVTLRAALRRYGIGREVRIRLSKGGDRLYIERRADVA